MARRIAGAHQALPVTKKSARNIINKAENLSATDSVNCPSCGSAAGSRCTTEFGATLRGGVAHKARVELFKSKEKKNA
jgi:hypothetical protein